MIPLGVVASAGGAWSPANLSGLVAWWDASDANSFTYSSGDYVSQWNDKSGNGYHLVQATTNQQPRRSATINGLSAVVGDGGNDGISVSGMSIAAPQTTWAIVKKPTTSGVFIGHKNSNLRGSTKWRIDTNGGFDGDNVETTLPHLVIGYHNAGSSSLQTDGGTLYTGDTGGTSPIVIMGLHGNFAGGTSSASECSAATICETGIVQGAISAGDRALLRSYAQTKWGTP